VGLFLLALALVLAAGALYTALRVRQFRRLHPAPGQFISAGGEKLHYMRAGLGRPVVLVPGVFGCAHDFSLSFLEPAAKEYDVLAVDRPGHGYSFKRRAVLSLDRQVEILHDVIQSAGMERPLLLGHSLGAALALAYALRYPESISGLVLVSGYVFPTADPVHWIYRIPQLGLLGDLLLATLFYPAAKIVARSVAEGVFWPDPVPENYFFFNRELSTNPQAYKAHALDVLNFKAFLEKNSARYAEIRIPAVILTGAKDLVAPAEIHAARLHRAMPGSELIILDETGHQPGIVRPGEVLRAIRRAWELADLPGRN